MHNAPPVVYPVGRFVWGRVLRLAIGSLSALGLMVWQTQSATSGSAIWAAWGLWLVCTGVAWVWTPRQALDEGVLAWDGEHWFWQAAGHTERSAQWVRVSVSVDMGQGLLLEVQALDERGGVQGQRLSAWLQADSMPSKWHGFRCAVYSRPKAIAQTDRAAQEGV